MSRPESELPEPSKLEALLREELLLRAKTIAHTVEERVRGLTQPQEEQSLQATAVAGTGQEEPGLTNRLYPALPE